MQILRGHRSSVRGLSFSATETAPLLASLAGRETRVSVWDLPTGRRRFIEGDGTRIDEAVFSPDGQFLAVKSRSNDIWVHPMVPNPGSDTQPDPFHLISFRRRFDGLPLPLVFPSTGNELWIVVPDQGDRTRLSQVTLRKGRDRGFPEIRLVKLDSFYIWGVGRSFSEVCTWTATPDGRLVFAGWDGTFDSRTYQLLWNLHLIQHKGTGELIRHRIVTGSEVPLSESNRTAISPDGNVVAILLAERGCIVTTHPEIADDHERLRFDRGNPARSLIALPADDGWLVGWQDGSVTWFDPEFRPLERWGFSIGPIVHLAVSPDGQLLAAAGSKHIVVWDAEM